MTFTQSELKAIHALAKAALINCARSDYVNPTDVNEYASIINRCQLSISGNEKALKAVQKFHFLTEEERTNWVNSSLTEYDSNMLSGPAYNCLRNAGVDTIGQLLEHSERSLLLMKNLGQEKLKDIKRFLALWGERLKEES